MIAKFTADCISQTLPSGGHFAEAADIPPTFFTEFMTRSQPNLQLVRSVPGAMMETVPKKRIMHTLGTKAHTAYFLLLQADLNILKGTVSPSLSWLEQLRSIPSNLH